MCWGKTKEAGDVRVCFSAWMRAYVLYSVHGRMGNSWRALIDSKCAMQAQNIGNSVYVLYSAHGS